jgi:predicted Rossmann fold nucleotide-binding protein DprA/Smf involved in DNA uptake
LSEHVAIVGSRVGADLEHVAQFVVELHARHPDTILVSGGADGTDKVAETIWLQLGGQLISLRPKQLGLETYGIERWELGGDSPKVFVLIDHPTFQTYASACIYRDMLIAEMSERTVAFFRRFKSPGAGFTLEHARECGKQVYEYEAV